MSDEKVFVSTEFLEHQKKEQKFRTECKSRGTELLDYDMYKRYKNEEFLYFLLVLMIYAMLFIFIGIKLGGQI